MSTKELYSIREWAPLSVIERIPVRSQRGIFPVNLNITCVDAVTEFLVLGSDVGIVFWYNRQTGEMQKLKPELTSRITCVKIVNSVEYMVAAGNAAGQVSVFQIQKQLPPDINLVAPCTRAKPIQRYTIRDLHRCAISCCEWSKNGMKLFSGDRQGVVVLTEFDYQTQVSKSVEILGEAYEIVQLSVYQSFLLVSTLYRSVVCQRSSSTGQWQLTQVGKKDRKQLIDCGGTFLKRDTKRPLMICGRPGLRFWIADTEGNVEKTLLFREAVEHSPTWEIPILNPKMSMTNSMTASNRAPVAGSDSNAVVDTKSFRELYLYAGEDSLLVTHDESTLYLLNLNRLRVEAVARNFRKILDFCVCEKEIFVLEGERSLLRLAPAPEKPNKTAKIIFNPSLPPPVPMLGSASCGTFEAPAEYEPAENVVVNDAEECFELPPIEALNLQIPIELAVESPRAAQNRRLEIFNQISEMEFDQSILHSSGLLQGRKKRRSREHKVATNTASEGIVEIGQAAMREQVFDNVATEVQAAKPPNSLAFTTLPTFMDASYCLDVTTSPATTTKGDDNACNLQQALSQYMPDLLSPGTLQRTIQQKAKTLAEELQLPEINLVPISEEEMRASQAAAMPPPPAPPPATPACTVTTAPSECASGEVLNPHVATLTHAYPRPTRVEHAGVQTTPHKKYYYMQDNGDYSDGQPVDDVCAAMRTTTLLERAVAGGVGAVSSESTCEEVTAATNSILSPISGVTAPAATTTPATTATPAPGALQFVATQPQEEVASILFDFRRVRDPLRRSPPNSAASTNSSEWEFLDN